MQTIRGFTNYAPVVGFQVDKIVLLDPNFLQAGEKEILNLLEKHDLKRAIIHWYSGPMDILRAMIEFRCYFTIGVEVLYSDYIKEITKTVPDHLLLTETDNPGALRWLKKNDEVGMPTAIKTVVEGVAELRRSTSEEIDKSLVQTNFLRLIADDPWLHQTTRQSLASG